MASFSFDPFDVRPGPEQRARLHEDVQQIQDKAAQQRRHVPQEPVEASARGVVKGRPQRWSNPVR